MVLIVKCRVDEEGGKVGVEKSQAWMPGLLHEDVDDRYNPMSTDFWCNTFNSSYWRNCS
jgi:hypothetical protein